MRRRGDRPVSSSAFGREETKSLLIGLKGRQAAKAQLEMRERFFAPASKIGGLAKSAF